MIRPEEPQDAQAIGRITTEAFANFKHSKQTEARIVDALRKAGVLTLSLVAVEQEVIVGHVAFSPVKIDGEHRGWYGLGPIAVRPDRQRLGIGSALIREGLARLQKIGAAGCVVLGDPRYYQRFGFENDPALRFEGPPPEHFMRLIWTTPAPSGRVAYHEAFGID